MTKDVGGWVCVVEWTPRNDNAHDGDRYALGSPLPFPAHADSSHGTRLCSMLPYLVLAARGSEVVVDPLLNTSFPQIQALAQVMGTPAVATKLADAARDVAWSIAMSYAKASGPKEANQIMAAFYDFARENGAKISMDKDNFSFTEDQIPLASAEDMVKSLVEEYGDPYESWVAEEGRNMPEHYREYFSIE